MPSFWIILPLAALATAAFAQQGLPPLIDRELLFGNPEITGTQLSPDGKYVAFLKPWKDTRNIWVKKTGEPFSAARLMTAEAKRPIPAYLRTRDGKFIVYVKDDDGDENFNVFAVDPSAAAAAGAEAPVSRDLTGVEGTRVLLYSAPKSDPDIGYIGLNDRDKAWHDLYKLKISTGEKTLIRRNTERIEGWIFDLKGQLRLAARVADNGDQELLRADPNTFTKVYRCSVFETCGAGRFHKDGRRVYLETNKGEVDLTSLELFDPQTGKTEKVESDPLNRVDLDGAVFSEVTEDVAFTVYTEDRTRRYFKDKSFAKDFQFLGKKLPGKEIGLTSRTKDERLWLISASVKEENGAWLITETMASPMGQAVDTTTLDRSSLVLRSRHLKQGPGGGQADSMSMNGKDKPIGVDLGGPLFAGAAGAPQVIACLPLQEGYTTAFRNFGLQRQRVEPVRLSVIGVEKVTVPAGSFEAFKVELTFGDGGAEKTTYWIARDSRKMVKAVALMPQMGGATLTAELTEQTGG